MQSNSEKKFLRWFGTASIGTFIGLGAGVLLGILIGGGLGGWFWYDMRHDGFNAFSDDTENLFGFCLTVGLAVVGAIAGLVSGGLAGLLISGLYAAVTSTQNRK